MVLNLLLFQYCFADWKCCFFTLRDWQYSISHKLEAHTKSQHSLFTTEARVVRQMHSRFLLVGQVPSHAYGVASVLWESCPVTRPRSCARLHRQTVKPLPPVTCVVSSSTYLFGWTDHGAVTAANPQTEAPRPSSLPGPRYDGAPSVYHTQRRALRHCIPVALEMCFTCKQRSFGSLHWPSPT